MFDLFLVAVAFGHCLLLMLCFVSFLFVSFLFGCSCFLIAVVVVVFLVGCCCFFVAVFIVCGWLLFLFLFWFLFLVLVGVVVVHVVVVVQLLFCSSLIPLKRLKRLLCSYLK